MLGRILRAVDVIEDNCGGIFITVAVFLITLQILLRVIFGSGISGLTEIATFCAIWSVFFVAGVGIKRNAHVRVDILVRIVPPKVALIIECIIAILTILVSLAFLVSGWLLVEESIAFGDSTLGTIRVPMWWAQAVMPIGGALMLIHSVRNFVLLLSGQSLESDVVEF